MPIPNRESTGEAILACLARVEAERQRRREHPGLASRVDALKRYQQRRFEHTYADLLDSALYGDAARFFLRELYGPYDFSRRDAQFAAVVPGLVRLFPADVIGTVAALAELHALSEVLDTRMADALDASALERASYAEAWCRVGDEASRRRQVHLMRVIGDDLSRYTRHPLLRHSLRAMRGPARVAGLEALQQFLEKGFETFRRLEDARAFVSTVESRELELIDALFARPGTSLPEVWRGP